MNMHSQNGDNNSPLKDDLDNISRVYGQMDQDEPPELLDQAVLNRAHRAVEGKPHWMQFGWLHGLTTTAVFVLAFFIIMNQRESVPGEEDGIFESPAVPIQADKSTRKTIPTETLERRMKVSNGTGLADEAIESAEFMQQGVLLKEAAPMADTVEAGDAAAQRSPAMAAAEPARSDLKSRAMFESKSETDPERELQEIIRLKQAGDETWRKELDLFLERHPDYPLPDELKTDVDH